LTRGRQKTARHHLRLGEPMSVKWELSSFGGKAIGGGGERCLLFEKIGSSWGEKQALNKSESQLAPGKLKNNAVRWKKKKKKKKKTASEKFKRKKARLRSSQWATRDIVDSHSAGKKTDGGITLIKKKTSGFNSVGGGMWLGEKGKGRYTKRT